MGGTGIIYTDDLHASADMMFHRPPASVQQHLGNAVHDFITRIQPNRPEFANIIAQRYNNLMSSSTIRHLDMVKAQINASWEPDAYKFLGTIEQVQQASDKMRAAVMAMPRLTELYNLGGVDGYEISKKDFDNSSGARNYLHRRITNGVIIPNETNGPVSGSGYSIFYEKVLEEDILTVMEKCSILGTWNIINECLDNSEDNRDPVSKWGGTR